LGITRRVQSLLKPEQKVQGVLRRWRGNERELLQRLEAKAAGAPAPQPSQVAEWVQLPSETYPGHYFYRNTRTGGTTWEAPEGVSFCRVVEKAFVRKPFKQLVIRGDCITLVSKRQRTAARTSGSASA
jgi:hypothetical protein